MNRNKSKALQIIRILAESVFVIMIIKIFIVSPFIVRGESMNDSLKENNIIFALKKTSIDIMTGYSRDNLKAFLKNKIIVVKNNEAYIMKRCVGIEGDTLIFSAGGITDTFIVPQDSIFVMGDNFRNSLDSRKFGFLNVKSVVGVQINNPVTIF